MPLIFIIIVIAIVVYSITKQQSRSNTDDRTNQRMWAEAANYQNLRLYPPNDESVFPALAGRVDGLSVEVWGDFDECGHALVICRVNFAHKFPFRFGVVKGDFGGETAGASYEIRGLTAPGVSVTASNGKELQAFLTPQNINILKNCVNSCHITKITESFILLGESGINDGKVLSGFIDRTVSAANALASGYSVMGDKIVPVEEDLPVPDRVLPPGSKDLPAPEKNKPFSMPPAAPPAPGAERKIVPVEEDLPVPDRVLPPGSKDVPAPEKNKPFSVPPAAPSAFKPVPPKPESTAVPVPPAFKPVPPKPEKKIAPALKPIISAAPQEPAPAAGVDLSAEGLAQALFSVSFPGDKEKAIFNGVAGQTVQWRGTLKSVYPYSTDFVFGKGPGTKATFEICEVASAYGMKNTIKATVCLGEDAMEILKGNTGKEFAFTGTLLKFEPFAREILLEKGSLQG